MFAELVNYHCYLYKLKFFMLVLKAARKIHAVKCYWSSIARFDGAVPTLRTRTCGARPVSCLNGVRTLLSSALRFEGGGFVMFDVAVLDVWIGYSDKGFDFCFFWLFVRFCVLLLCRFYQWEKSLLCVVQALFIMLDGT